MASTHELAGETAFTYNEQDQITKIIQLGQSYEYQYDKMGRLILSNESDNPVKISYNVEGLISEVRYSTNNWNRYDRDSAGNIAAMSMPGRNRITFEYDSCGRLISIADAMNNRRTLQYDPAGNLIRVVSPGGHAEHLSYDRTNRLTRYVDRNGDFLKIALDWQDRVVRKEDGAGNMIAYTYDDSGRLVKILDSLDREILMDYTDEGFLTRFVDGNINVTEYYYNRFNHIDLTFRTSWKEFLPIRTNALPDGATSQINRGKINLDFCI